MRVVVQDLKNGFVVVYINKDVWTNPLFKLGLSLGEWAHSIDEDKKCVLIKSENMFFVREVLEGI